MIYRRYYVEQYDHVSLVDVHRWWLSRVWLQHSCKCKTQYWLVHVSTTRIIYAVHSAVGQSYFASFTYLGNTWFVVFKKDINSIYCYQTKRFLSKKLARYRENGRFVILSSIELYYSAKMWNLVVIDNKNVMTGLNWKSTNVAAKSTYF